MIQVGNGRLDGWLGDNKVYIGRGSYGKTASPLANPFPITGNYTREDVVGLYKQWLWESIKNKSSIQWLELIRLARLYRKTNELHLMCWCAPELCHGDIIKKAILWIIDNDYDQMETV